MYVQFCTNDVTRNVFFVFSKTSYIYIFKDQSKNRIDLKVRFWDPDFTLFLLLEFTNDNVTRTK